MQPSTLDRVEEAFSHWRQSRRNQRETIPQELWDRVFELHKYYSQAEICRRLRLCGGQFKQKMTEMLLASQQGDFVVAQNPAPHKESLMTLSLSSSERTLSVSVGIHDIGHILPHFGALL